MSFSNNTGATRSAGNVVHVLVAEIVLSLFSGVRRGAEPDRWAADLATACQDAVFQVLAKNWCHAAMAFWIVWLASFALLCLGLLLAGDVFRRLHCLSMFLVDSDLSRRRGRKLAAISVALGYSLPIAAVIAIASKTHLSTYAVVYFVLTYGLVVFSTEPESSAATLTFYSRFRNAIARGCERERRMESVQDLDGG